MMKFNNKHIIRSAAAILLCVGLASCSQDELDLGTGQTLPDGKYPLKITASVEGLASRSDSKDSWNDDDLIAVKIYPSNGVAFPVTGKYFLNTDGSVKRTQNPLSWPHIVGTVKAWFPYLNENEVKTVSLANQSEGIVDYDFLIAESKDRKYSETIDLVFKHQMAKVSTTLVRGDGISEEEFATARLYYSGFTSADFSETGVTADKIGQITPDSVNTAILAPRE
ncbi:MAG: fimbrillin family protein, partial [Paramuribaculum sp.]|nr:fimbrillin family protein [Paramuribaculum sp.]